jgi:hypothetical protein
VIKNKGNMTDYTIPMIIGMTLAFALGAGLGGLWGLIVRKLVHDMREHTISKAPEIYKPETVEQLAKKIIDYNFRFLDDFDFKEWE